MGKYEGHKDNGPSLIKYEIWNIGDIHTQFNLTCTYATQGIR